MKIVSYNLICTLIIFTQDESTFKRRVLKLIGSVIRVWFVKCLPLERCGLGEAFQRIRDLSLDGQISGLLHRVSCFLMLFLRGRERQLSNDGSVSGSQVRTLNHTLLQTKPRFYEQLSMCCGLEKYLKFTACHEDAGTVTTHMQPLSLPLAQGHPQALLRWWVVPCPRPPELREVHGSYLCACSLLGPN